MGFRNYKIFFLIRILILTFGIFLLVYSLLILRNPIRAFFAALFCAIIIAEFLGFVNRINKDFKSFLEALIYEDFSNYYSKSKQSGSDVYELFDKLNSKYRSIAYDKELQHSFLQTIIKHINLGILVINKSNDIILINNYLLDLLKIYSPRSTSDIAQKSERLKKEIDELIIGKPKLVELVLEGQIFRLSLNASDFKLDGIEYRLVSIQDINLELDEQEIIAWQKLIRVLTHEIMNSVTPISSLASSLSSILDKSVSQNELSKKQLEYLSNGLNAVQDRSEGLLKFTEAYKKLTQLKHPEFEKICLVKLIENVVFLHKAKLDQLGIDAGISYKEEIEVLIDKSMIEQVVINLVNNSIKALENVKKPKIEITVQQENKRTVVQVIDNGAGIPADKIDQIFIPFFTTRKEGSGIGLSFARQVMRLHKGTITVKSIEHKTIFTLKF